MHQIAKLSLILTVGLGLNAVAFAQAAPSEANKPKSNTAEHEKPKAENHAKHKATTPAAPVAQSAKAVEKEKDKAPAGKAAQPTAAPNKVVAKSEKSDKDGAAKPAVAGVAAKHDKTVPTNTDKPEASVGSGKSVK